MAPIKFEEQLKEKLEQRALEPSSQAWSKLAQRLDDDKKSSKTPFFWWFGIAASIAVLLMVSVSIFNNQKTPGNPQIVIEDKVEDNQNPKNDIITINPKETIEIVKNRPDKEQVISLDVHKKQNLKKEKASETLNTKTTVIAKVKHSEKPLSHNAEALKTGNEISQEILDKQLKTVISEFKTIQDKNKTVTDRQIDSLLKAASKALLRDKLYNEGTNVVNADALLQDVEEDLDQSFRTRIYEALKSGFNEVKTAVAKRNN